MKTKLFFISFILFLSIIIPNCGLAAGTCSCNPHAGVSGIQESGCMQICSPGEYSFEGGTCECSEFSTETADEAACNTYCSDNDSTKSSWTEIKEEETPEEEGKKTLEGAISAVDTFLGKKPIQGEMISDDAPTVIGNVIKVALGIIGSVALVLFIYGGVTWMTSGGSPERIKKAKNTLIWSVLGLTIIVSSYAIVSAIIKPLEQEVGEKVKREPGCLEKCSAEEQQGSNFCLTEHAENPDVLEDCKKTVKKDATECRAKCAEQFK